MRVTLPGEPAGTELRSMKLNVVLMCQAQALLPVLVGAEFRVYSCVLDSAFLVSWGGRPS